MITVYQVLLISQSSKLIFFIQSDYFWPPALISYSVRPPKNVGEKESTHLIRENGGLSFLRKISLYPIYFLNIVRKLDV